MVLQKFIEEYKNSPTTTTMIQYWRNNQFYLYLELCALAQSLAIRTTITRINFDINVHIHGDLYTYGLLTMDTSPNDFVDVYDKIQQVLFEKMEHEAKIAKRDAIVSALSDDDIALIKELGFE